MKLILINATEASWEESIRNTYTDGVIPTCATCKHWEATGWLNSEAHYCRKIEENESDMVGLYGEYGYDANIITKPEFFCALWEAK